MKWNGGLVRVRYFKFILLQSQNWGTVLWYQEIGLLESFDKMSDVAWNIVQRNENTAKCWLICGVLACFSEKAMAPHSSTLAWKIPWTEEPGELQSMGSLRVGQDWATSLSLFTFMHWRRKWQPTPVFLPGESQGQGSLVAYRLWGHTESDMTEAT